jgi:hypothetical protein
MQFFFFGNENCMKSIYNVRIFQFSHNYTYSGKDDTILFQMGRKIYFGYKHTQPFIHFHFFVVFLSFIIYFHIS